MRIGLSTSVIQRGRTGIAQHVFALLRAMQTIGASHRFVVFALEEDLPLFDFIDAPTEIVPVPEQFRPAVKNILWHQFALPRLAREQRLDLLHVPSYRRMLWPKPCPLVATIHDLAPFRVPGKYDLKRMFYGRVIARRLANRQNALIAISENTARDIRRFFRVPGETIHVVYNGIDHGRFHPADREAASRRAAGKYSLQRPFLLYVSRLEHPAKNHIPLIAAFERFKRRSGLDWELVFAGADWHGAAEIRKAIRASSAVRAIRCLGFVSDLDLPDLYRAAHAFVYPSLYEGFGMPPVEAMACGCPVISSGRGSLSEVIGDAAMQIDPTDAEDMAAKLAQVAGEKTRSRLREAGLRRAREFDWTQTAAQTLAIYEQTCGCTTNSLVPASR